MQRFEPLLFGFFAACWLTVILGHTGRVTLAGSLPLSLYALYSAAAALGWIFGNLYTARARRADPPLRRRVRAVYLLGPPGVVYLLRAMSPAVEQAAAPLVPLYAWAVYGALFLVPVLLPHPRR